MPLDPNKTAVVIQCDKSLISKIDAYCAKTGARRPSAVVAILSEYFQGQSNREAVVMEGELGSVDVKQPPHAPGKPKHQNRTKS